MLAAARRYLPYPNKGHTPDEAPLRLRHLPILREVFPRLEVESFQLLSMARRVLRRGKITAGLEWCDARLLRMRLSWADFVVTSYSLYLNSPTIQVQLIQAFTGDVMDAPLPMLGVAVRPPAPQPSPVATPLIAAPAAPIVVAAMPWPRSAQVATVILLALALGLLGWHIGNGQRWSSRPSEIDLDAASQPG